ncbi:uncharacterized protein UV8b_01460 [Ustilaginoidea virens]|uniref:Nudix hydrolase domain-containing protein n=1 Tax=Ustilaginoidea virens TaxID=1159556 RepID=A0A8E5HLN0_USTVR|nr:uncharacterized protein UV8b_01460 [Ustilaginoidea virens]QUC17219.1 hypothetical protein UV8b_01460 [Ustilaginoidea virens]
MPTPEKHARVGVAVVILNKENQFVAGVRKGSHGSGKWQLPGGHIDWMEPSIFDTARREAREETGLEIKPIKIFANTNDVFAEEDKHYVTIFVLAVLEDPDAQPALKEEQKCEVWEWKTWNDLRQLEDNDLFLPLVNLLAQKLDLEAICKVDNGSMTAAQDGIEQPNPKLDQTGAGAVTK